MLCQTNYWSYPLLRHTIGCVQENLGANKKIAQIKNQGWKVTSTLLNLKCFSRIWLILGYMSQAWEVQLAFSSIAFSFPRVTSASQHPCCLAKLLWYQTSRMFLTAWLLWVCEWIGHTSKAWCLC